LGIAVVAILMASDCWPSTSRHGTDCVCIDRGRLPMTKR